MKQILVIPTWVLVNIFTSFLPVRHLWRGRKFTLSDWAKHSTDATIAFSIFFWISGVCEVFAILYLIKN